MIERLPAASSFAADIDGLIRFVAIVVLSWGVLAEIVFFSLIFKFREKGGRKAKYITGEEKSEKRWISVPHALVFVCDVFIVIAAVRVWGEVKQTLPPPDRTVRIIAQQWAWTFVDPGPDGVLDTDDDVTTVDELHLELGKTYRYELESKDVVHSFSVPAFRLKQDAVPGRMIAGWFKPIEEGTFDVQCAEICGIGHGLMPARVVIEPAERHASWAKASSSGALARGTTVTGAN
ncbi:MAG TPA: hypothetical protein VHC69_14725 [Polyangiaceae bacterium]|nr:hypothetical protein [Polyangiaceae bacterium]